MSEWKIVTLQEVVRPDREITYGIVQPGPDVRPDGVPLIRGMDYSGGSIAPDELYHVKPEIDAPYTRSKVKGGDVLLSIVGNVGLIAMVPDSLDGANITQTTARISVDKCRFDHHFIYQAVKSEDFQLGVRKYVKGSAQPGLNLSDVRRLKLLAPISTTIQRKIARILGTVDGLIERTEALIAKQQQIKQGLLQDLFTRGVDAHGRLRPPHSEAPELYHETALGWLPKGWRVDRMDAIGRLRGGKRLPKGMPFADGPTAYPYVRVVDMVDASVDMSALVYVTSEVQEFIAQYTIDHSDIYISIAGTIGLFGRVPEELDGAQLTENALKLCEIDRSRHNVDFLIDQFNSHLMQLQIAREIGTGGGVPKLAMHRVAATQVRVPLKDEQDAIAERLRSIRKHIQAEQHQLDKLRLLKSGLMQDLLTGRVSVEQLATSEASVLNTQPQ